MRILLALLVLGCASRPPPGPAAPGPAAPAVGGMPAEGADAECRSVGGTCVAVSECAPGTGFLAEPDCGAVHLACCVSSCAGTQEFACCDGEAKFRPACEDGQLVCKPGQERCSP
jgi:hypothetical protein